MKARLNRASSMPTRLYRSCADTCGAVAVVAAIVFPVVVAGLGLGIETGYWYMTQRKLQHAADLSAHAASARNRAGDAVAEIRVAALNVASNSGFLPEIGTISVNTPPTSGGYAGDPDAVEVILTETQTRWFTAVFTDGPLVIRARAVTRLEGGAEACVLALSPTADGAVTVSGSTNVTLDGCDVASNSVSASAFLMSGSNASMTTDCVHAVGQASVSSGLSLTGCSDVHVNAPVVRDPYRGVAEPEQVGSCQNSSVGNPTQETTITPSYNHPSGIKSMRFCKGLDIKGKVTFKPGLYIVEGGTFTINGGNLEATSAAEILGEGVTFYLSKTANLKLNGNVTLQLSAPTNGPFAGILFFGTRDAGGVSQVINGTSGSTLQGAIYAPASDIAVKGNSTTSDGCTQVIGSTVTMTGNSTLRSSCENAGTNTILANEGIKIVE